MGIYRLYTGDDGSSRIDETHLESHPELASPQNVSNITFRERPAGHFVDWHAAHRRKYLISLTGDIEVGLGAGPLFATNPVTPLVEDTTGQGHTTRVVGDQPGIHVVIPLEY